MRLQKIRWKKAERPNWALPFFAGLLAGAIFVYMNADSFLMETGFLSQLSLERLSRMELNENAFFFYALRRRVGTLWLVAILSTTFVGIFTTYLFVFWTGICGGVVAAVSVMRYGMKGLLLIAGSMMPHFLCYIPAFLFFAVWCFQTCVRLYYPVRDYTENVQQQKKGKITGRFFMIHGIVIVGIILESYVNPGLMGELTKLF